MIIYIYSNQTGLQVDAIEGRDNVECERLAGDNWGSNDYHWAYMDLTVSNAVRSEVSEDYDPTPWCSACGARRQADCDCGPIADNA